MVTGRSAGRESCLGTPERRRPNFDKVEDLKKLSDRCMLLVVDYYKVLPEHRYKQQVRDEGED
jgi:hypothetical protein